MEPMPLMAGPYNHLANGRAIPPGLSPQDALMSQPKPYDYETSGWTVDAGTAASPRRRSRRCARGSAARGSTATPRRCCAAAAGPGQRQPGRRRRRRCLLRAEDLPHLDVLDDISDPMHVEDGPDAYAAITVNTKFLAQVGLDQPGVARVLRVRRRPTRRPTSTSSSPARPLRHRRRSTPRATAASGERWLDLVMPFVPADGAAPGGGAAATTRRCAALFVEAPPAAERRRAAGRIKVRVTPPPRRDAGAARPPPPPTPPRRRSGPVAAAGLQHRLPE